MSFSNIGTVTLHDAATIIIKMTPVTDQPVFLWGAPGTGKSAIIREIIAALSDRTGEKWGLIDCRASQLAAVDTRGVPKINKAGATQFGVPDWLPKESRDGKFGMLLLDELLLGSPAVQAAFYQLLHERTLGEYTLPAGWVTAALSNRPADRAGMNGKIDTAIAGRFYTHLNVVPDVDELLEYASQQTPPWDARLYAFLDFRGRPTMNDGNLETAGLIHQYPDGNPPKGHIAIASPRTWNAVNSILSANLGDLEHVTIEGAVGKAAAAELTGFLNVCNGLTDISVALHSPDSDQATVPTELSAQYATAVMLAKRCNKENIGNAVTFIRRMSQGEELESIFFKIVTMRDKAFFDTAEYIQFKVDNNL